MPDHAVSNKRLAITDRIALIGCFFNSTGSQKLRDNLKAFVDGLGSYANALHLVECIAPGQVSALTGLPNVHVVQSNSVLWQKERLLNIALDRLPDTIDAVVWCDTDIIYEDSTWIPKTLEKLQEIDVLQPFQFVSQMPTLGEEPVESYGSCVSKNPDVARLRFHGHGHTGYAWAIRREIIQEVGFFDECIIGGADHAMAHGFTGTSDCDCIPPLLGAESALQKRYENWAKRLWREHGPLRLGCLEQNIQHRRHGSDKGRMYLVRNKLLEHSGFDPETHLTKNSWGSWEWSPTAFAQRDLVKAYFSQRNEDVVDEVTA